MGGPLTQAGDFLITTLFQLYMIAVLLRFLLQMVRANYYNPLSQFLVAVTDPVLRPLRRYIPGYKGIDWASIVLLFTLGYLKFLLLYMLVYQFAPNFAGLVVLTIADLIKLTFWVVFFALIIRAIASWFLSQGSNPLLSTLALLTEPLLRPVRRLIPPISGMDLSVLFALIGLQLINITLVQTFVSLGRVLTIGMR